MNNEFALFLKDALTGLLQLLLISGPVIEEKMSRRGKSETKLQWTVPMGMIIP